MPGPISVKAALESARRLRPSNHRCGIIAGIRGDECAALLQDFFRSKRDRQAGGRAVRQI